MSNNAVGCIAHYQLNDNAVSATVIDETGDHNGTLNDAGGTATTAAHTVVGKINSGQDFDGGDDYIEIADHNDFSPALTPLSVAAWVNMDDATNYHIASKWGNGADNREWSFFSDASDLLTGTIFDESPNAKIGRAYSVARTGDQGAWVLFGFTYDGGITSSGCKLYRNGVQVDDGNNESGTFVTVRDTTSVVRMARRAAVYSNGKTDNVMIFNRELSPDEWVALYNAGNGTEQLGELDYAVVEGFTRTLRRR